MAIKFSTRRKVVDNSLINISGKFEACNLKAYQEKSLLVNIDCRQIYK